MSETPEFSHLADVRGITADPVKLSATEAERAALAKRFGLIAIHKLAAELTIEAADDIVSAKGRMQADIVQSCAVSGEDLPAVIDEEITLRFVPLASLEASEEDEEIELEEDDLDEIGYTGTSFDLGEAVAQSLALAIDPYAEGPNADAFRREQGLIEEDASGPLADALRALKKD